jgi:hypothetical protein
LRLQILFSSDDGALAIRDHLLLSVPWADDGTFDVDRFVRGPWEGEALAL